MKKQGRNFIILVAVLAVLLAGYYGLVQYNRHQQEKEADQVDGVVLADIDPENILRFSYRYNGETYAFERVQVTAEPERAGVDTETQQDAQAAEPQAETQWVSVEDPSLSLMQSRLDIMAAKFTDVVARDVITAVTDLAQYGLEDPENVLHWETAENSYTYYVGEYNSFGGVYYICEPDSDTVYTVDSSLVTGFGYSLEELIEEEAEATEETEEP